MNGTNSVCGELYVPGGVSFSVPEEEGEKSCTVCVEWGLSEGWREGGVLSSVLQRTV